MARAAEDIRSGRLVGMPTETVYGVAANALDPIAVHATFEAKGRPADNPLIVHIASALEVDRVAAAFPPVAALLAERFWPGPLTLVLPKAAVVPDVTTGGLDTVAVRVPAHPVARALIHSAGVPIAAPSANLFMGLSPTQASDIDPELAAHLALILDGGPCEVGLESTVVDLAGPEPLLLRPGGVSLAELAEVLGKPPPNPASHRRRAPGMYPRHYAPRTPVRIVARLRRDDPGIRLGGGQSGPGEGQIVLPADPLAYGVGLYASLHHLDRQGHPEIFVEAPPETPAWAAVWDRLRRAATGD